MKHTITVTHKIAALATAVALVVSACSGGDKEEVVTATTGSTPTTTETTAPPIVGGPATSVVSTVVPSTDEGAPTIRMPLTGLPIASKDEIPDRPALIVKISNAGPTVRPQAGLNNADIVVEEVINDASTRFAAVFHSEGSDVVGPIRSGRAQDPDFLLMFDRPLFAYSGANSYAINVLRNSGMIDVGVDRAAGYYRRSGAGKRAPNNLYNDTETLWQYSDKTDGRPSRVFRYTDRPKAIKGDPVAQIDLVLDSVHATWKYDADDDMYYRYHDGAPHSTENGSELEQVSAKNVVVMVADYTTSPDGNPFAHVTGTNAAYVFSNGKVQVGTWEREDTAAPPNLTLENGKPMLLQPGRTWVEIPRNLEGKVSYS